MGRSQATSYAARFVMCGRSRLGIDAHFGWSDCMTSTRLSPDEIAYILNHSGSKALLVDTELAPLVERCKSQLESVELFVSIVDRELGAAAPPQTLDGPEYEAFLETGSDGPIANPV